MSEFSIEAFTVVVMVFCASAPAPPTATPTMPPPIASAAAAACELMVDLSFALTKILPDVALTLSLTFLIDALTVPPITLRTSVIPMATPTPTVPIAAATATAAENALIWAIDEAVTEIDAALISSRSKSFALPPSI